MKRMLKAVALAVAMVVGTATAALACPVSSFNATATCDTATGTFVVKYEATTNAWEYVRVYGGDFAAGPAKGVIAGSFAMPGSTTALALTAQASTSPTKADGERKTINVVGFDQGCEQDHVYRVVAGMPRYRGEKFTAPAGVTYCNVGRVSWDSWFSRCADHEDAGLIGAKHRTYVRLRDLTAGTFEVLLDLRARA